MSKPKSTPRELPEEGYHDAVCKIVADIGTQEPKNEAWNAVKKIILVFELVDESSKDKIVWQSLMLTFTAKSKGLARTMKSWLGVKNVADYDMANALNKSASIQIEHSQDGNYANIVSVTQARGKVAKGFMKPASVFLDENWDEDDFEAMPDWIKNKIVDSPEYDEVASPKSKKANKRKGRDEEEDEEEDERPRNRKKVPAKKKRGR